MSLFGPIYDRLLRWSRHDAAPWYLAGLSFAESSFFPIPPDVMLAPGQPQDLIDQLAVDGRLVIPVGGRGGQELLQLTRREDGTIHRESLCLVSFVPLLEGKVR